MKIANHEIENLVIKIATEKFSNTTFHRRPLMKAVEAHIKTIGFWTPEDDARSGSAGKKSVGLAKMDWAVSHLYEHGRLTKMSRDQWRVA